MRETLEKPEAGLDRAPDGALSEDAWAQEQRRGALLETARLLWNHRRVLWRAVQYGFLLSVILALLIPKQFQSTARLMPPDNPSNMLSTLAALSGRAPAGLGALAGELMGVKNTSALFVAILRSQTVQDRLIQKYDLMKTYWAWRIEDARDALDDHTTVNEDRKSGIVTLTVTDKDPLRARNMAQTYVDELNRLVADVSTSAARRERIFIEERLKVVKQELDTASLEFSRFASKNTAIDIREQGRAMVEALATLQGQLIAAKTELEGLRQVYTSNNIRVRSAQARIDELKRQIENLGGKDESGMLNKVLPHSELAADSAFPSIRLLPILGVQYADLLRRAKVAETVFELLTQQYELARVQEAKEVPTVKVLDFPQVPERKSFPPRSLLVLAGTLGTFLFASIWILARHQWDRISPHDPQRMFIEDIYNVVVAKVHHSRARLWRVIRRKDA